MKLGLLSGRALALVILGWSLLRVLLKRLFGGGPSGLQLFDDNYAAEGLAAFKVEERRTLQQLNGCIACGRCDIGEAQRIADSGGEYPGLMRVVLACTRSMPDFDAAARALRHVPTDALEGKRSRCPVRFPFSELEKLVRAKTPQKESGC